MAEEVTYPPEFGGTLGRYTLGEKLGEGGMGAVFRCRAPGTGVEFAVKFLSSKVFGNENCLIHFDRERRVLARLRHPNIVAIHDHGTATVWHADRAVETPLLVMELCLGPDGKPHSLGALQRQDPDYRVAPALLLGLIEGVFAAVGYLHGQGLIHRDLKPDNVLLLEGPGGRLVPKLSDFGLIAISGDEEMARRYQLSVSLSMQVSSASGGVVGTFAYMSPEQRRGESLDARSDVYSLGLMLYRLSTGYERQNPRLTPRPWWQRLGRDWRRAPYDLPSERVPAFPPWFDRLTVKCLTRDREQRYRDANALAGVARRARRLAQARRHAARVLPVLLVVAGLAVALWRIAPSPDVSPPPHTTVRTPQPPGPDQSVPAEPAAATAQPQAGPAVPATAPTVPDTAPKGGEAGQGGAAAEAPAKDRADKLRAAYVAAMALGDAALEAKEWPTAESAFGDALKFDGYTDDVVARLSRALASAEVAKAKADWPGVRAAAAPFGPTSPTRPTDPAAAATVAERLARLDALRVEAEEQSKPRLEIVAMLNGQNQAGAEVRLVPAGARDQAAIMGRTPCTLEPEAGRNYTLTVTLAPRGTQQFAPFEQPLTVDWAGRRQLRAEIGGQRLPVEGQPWTVPGVGMEFVWVAALKLWVGKYEVTNAEYRAREPAHDSKEYAGHSLNGDRQPVVYVNYDDACAYAKWLTDRERQDGRLPAGLSYRLPTKDEWTAFAQCGDSREYPWGSAWPPKYGNYCGQETGGAVGSMIDGYRDGSVVACPVEQSGENDWHLFGVGGNVWECTSKHMGGGFEVDASRGASWHGSYRRTLRCDCRSDASASRRYCCGGFRLVLSSPEPGGVPQGLVPAPPASAEPAVGASPSGPVEGQAWTVPGVGMEFVWVAALKLWVGKYEVTNAEYRACKPNHSSEHIWDRRMGANREPVANVSGGDAQLYAQWLTDRERQTRRLPAGLEYRLPTDDEWTAFAQCGDNREYPWGNGWPPKYGNYAGEETKSPRGISGIDGYRDGSVATCPVEQSGENDWHLFGVGGNVWECTSERSGVYAWRGASCINDSQDILRCSCRGVNYAAFYDTVYGFRLVLSR